MGDTIRVTVILENAGNEVTVKAGLTADVRRVEAEGLIDMGDTRPAPMSVPEDLIGHRGPQTKRPVPGTQFSALATSSLA